MKKRPKSKKAERAIRAAKKTGISKMIFDALFKAVLILIAGTILALAYTGIRKTLAINKEPVAAAQVAAAETPAPVNTPVPVKKAVILPEYSYLLKAVKTKEEIPRIHIEAARALLKSGKAVFVDARGFGEYELEHIKNAVSIQAGTPQDKIKQFADVLKNRVLITYCHGIGCRLSDKVAYALFDAGYRKIAIFFGGWNEWTQAGYPVDKYEPPAKYRHLFEDAVSEKEIPEVTLDEAKFLYDKMLANIIDVDYQDEYKKTHIDRAASMPVDKIDELLPGYAGVLKQKPVLLYCHGIGRKSRAAAEKIFLDGNKKVLLFIQALPQWEKAGYPLYKAPDQAK